MSIYLHTYVYLCLSMYLICRSIDLSVCPFIDLSVYLSISLFIYLSVFYLSVYLYICLSRYFYQTPPSNVCVLVGIFVLLSKEELFTFHVKTISTWPFHGSELFFALKTFYLSSAVRHYIFCRSPKCRKTKCRKTKCQKTKCLKKKRQKEKMSKEKMSSDKWSKEKLSNFKIVWEGAVNTMRSDEFNIFRIFSTFWNSAMKRSTPLAAPLRVRFTCRY
jgi:hypothetical protein